MMSKVAAIGDAVNLASRIETANKNFGTLLLISQSAFEEVQGLVEIHKTYRSTLKGKSGEHVLYNIKI
jgi:adenylate cyclase